MKAALDDPELQRRALPLACLPRAEGEAQMPARLEAFAEIWAATSWVP